MENELKNFETCIECQGANNVTVTDSDSTGINEANTKCSNCGHVDFWAFGYFESGAKPE